MPRNDGLFAIVTTPMAGVLVELITALERAAEFLPLSRVVVRVSPG